MAVEISDGVRILAGSAASVAMAPVAVVAASLGFLAVHGYRGLGVVGNVVRGMNQIKTDEEFVPAMFGEKLQTPLKSTYNSYRQFVNAAIGREVIPEWTAKDYNPHPLDPTHDLDPETNYEFELTKGLDQAKNLVIDFVNSGGMTYPMTLESGNSAQSYTDTRKKTMDEIAAHIGSKQSTTVTLSPVTADVTNATNALMDFQHYIRFGLEMEPSKCLDYFQTLQTEIESQLTKQFEADKTEVETSCGGDLLLKNEMLKTLTESHDKQLKELNEKISADKIKLQEAARKENERVFFLAHVIKQNPDLEPVFKKLSDEARHARTPTGGSSISAAVSPDATISFYGVDPAKLTEFKAFGSVIKRDDKGKYSIDLPSRLWPSNFGLEDKTKHRIVMLVKAIKATSGSEKIELFVDHPDPVHAMYLARKMFEACREEGYDEKQITIICNKKTVPLLSSGNSVDKDGKEVRGEQGLIRNATEKEAIDKKAAQFSTVRDTNFNKLKAQVQASRPEKDMKDIIADHKASSPPTPTP